MPGRTRSRSSSSGSDDPGSGTPTGLIFGGGSSGTFAILVTADGQRNRRPDDGVPAGLPNEASVAAAWQHRPRRPRRDPGRRPGPDPERDRPQPGRPIVIQVVAGPDRRAEDARRDLRRPDLRRDPGGRWSRAAFGALYARRALAPIRTSLANQRLALRRQREFAADASHELRTPLTVIRSSVEYLGRHRDRARCRRLATPSRTSTRRWTSSRPWSRTCSCSPDRTRARSSSIACRSTSATSPARQRRRSSSRRPTATSGSSSTPSPPR